MGYDKGFFFFLFLSLFQFKVHFNNKKLTYNRITSNLNGCCFIVNLNRSPEIRVSYICEIYKIAFKLIYLEKTKINGSW